MKLLYILLVIIICMMLLYCGIKALKKKESYSKIVFALEMILLILIANSYMAHTTHDIELAYVGYGIYYVAMDWLMLVLIRFVQEYTTGLRMPRKLIWVINLFGAVDVFFMAANCVDHFVFELEEITYNIGWSYYGSTIDKWPFLYHLVFLYFLVAMVFIVLTINISNSAKLYRRTYWIFGIIFFLATLIDVVFSVSNYPLRLSTILYGIFGIVVYYFSMEYGYHDVVNTSLEYLLKSADNGIMLFDVHKRLLYYNEKGMKMFDIDAEDTSAAEALNREYYNKYIDEDKPIHQHMEEHVVDGRLRYYEHNYYFIYDEQGFLVGNAIMVTDRTEEYEKLDRDHYLLTHDSLTGLYTMQRFSEVTREMLDSYPNQEFCMICSNIKDFKLINDLFGTDRGDEVLLMQASMMQRMVASPGTYGRIGGDKFALCMPKERFREEIFVDGIKKMQNEYTSSVYRMHIYIGVYNIKNRDETISVMCDRCNMAIESISGDYSRIVAYCKDELIEASVEENRMCGEFEDALRDHQFKMYLQPQVTYEGELCGAEALVRWVHPEMGMIVPDRFIPIFERSALIYRLDYYIWEEAVKTLKRWSEMGHEELYISINISVKDFFYLDIYQELKGLVEKYEVSPKRLKLEITESVFLVEPASRMQLIERLRDYGFEVELGDFGSGYSSLNMLKDIHTDGLKVDRDFLLSATADERGYNVIKSIYHLASDLNMKVIVEGVETEEQLNMMKEIGESIFQGYYFSKPIPMREFELKYRLL